MRGAVDLNAEVPFVPVRVEIPPLAMAVDTHRLPRRWRQMAPAAQPDEIDLGEGLRATGDVLDRLRQQRAATGSPRTGERVAQIGRPYQLLLAARGKQR